MVTGGDGTVAMPPSGAATEPTSAALASGELRTIGPYRILRLLGRGGMGVVYKAVDTRLGRTVALKVIRGGGDAGPEELARFRLEAQNAAKLQHPHIVPIHDIGQSGDLDYFTMDYIEGITLWEWQQLKERSYRERAEMLEKIARAVHHAHEQSIIHRDLKPSNVMVDMAGEPHVMDFGLARNIESAQGLTVSGTALGTPQYMPPEQAKGSHKEIGPHSDVYSLGAVLYEMLCGKTPFQGETVFQILRAVIQDDAVPPRKIVRLADDLRAYVDGEAISARPLSRTERAWRGCRKRPVLFVAAVLVLAFSGVAGWLLHFGSASQRVAVLGEKIRASLPEQVPTAEELQRLDGMCTELEARNAEAGAAARHDVNKRFADSLRKLVLQPRLEQADKETIEAALKVLAARDQSLGTPVEQEYRQRSRHWDTVFELAPPFDKVASVFKKGTVEVQDNALRCPQPKNTPAGPLCPTKVDASGNVQLEGSFSPWQEAGMVGLGFKSEMGRGYAFVLCALSETPPAKGEVRPPPAAPTLGNAAAGLVPVVLQVWRAGAKAAEFAVDGRQLGGEQLTLRVQREGTRFTVETAGGLTAAFDDPFPLPARERGCYEALLPAGARLRLLRASQQGQAAAPSPLERADDLYERGQYEEALAAYREQNLQTLTGSFGQEARYKQALSLVGLKRQEEAAALFEAVGAEEGKRWPLLSLCQLMLLRLDRKEFDRVWTLLDMTEIKFGTEQLMISIPERLKERIRELYISEFSGLYLMGCTPERVAKLERALKATRLIDSSHWRHNWVRWNVVRAKHWLKDYTGAERQARDALAQIPETDGWHLTIAEELSWVLRLKQQPAAALKVVETLLLDKKGKARPDRMQLLLERARVFVAMEKWEDAEADLALLFKTLTAKEMTYRHWGSGHMLQGFLAERRGDKKAMEEAWLAGTVEKWWEGRGDKEFPKGTMEKVILMHLGALSGTLQQEHMDTILAAYGERGEGSRAASSKASTLFDMLRSVYESAGSDLMATAFDITPETIVKLWQQPRGREVTRAVAFQSVPLSDLVGGPMCLLLYGTAQRGMPRPLTDDEDKILWDAAWKGFGGLRDGKLGLPQIAQLGMAFMGETGSLGWGGLAAKLSPDVRGPMAYFLGYRFEVLARGDDALAFWQMALKDAPAGSALRQLAERELKRIGKGQ
ncbi:MAG: protein kinase [Planctomycetota bacterium]|nr:protein kinase [Planctomycetota bacterium]